jgi:hypothetical protein
MSPSYSSLEGQAGKQCQVLRGRASKYVKLCSYQTYCYCIIGGSGQNFTVLMPSSWDIERTKSHMAYYIQTPLKRNNLLVQYIVKFGLAYCSPSIYGWGWLGSLFKNKATFPLVKITDNLWNKRCLVFSASSDLYAWPKLLKSWKIAVRSLSWVNNLC